MAEVEFSSAIVNRRTSLIVMRPARAPWSSTMITLGLSERAIPSKWSRVCRKSDVPHPSE